MKLNASMPAPDFSLEDTAGDMVSLRQFRGERHVVVVFLRGFV